MNNKIFFLGILGVFMIGIIIAVVFDREMSKRPVFHKIAAQSGEIKASINLSGKVVPEETADLGFERGGKITELPHAVGDSVSKGDILAYVNKEDLEAQLRQAKSLVSSSQATLEQYQELTKKEKAKYDSLKKQKTGVNSADKRAQDKQIEASEAQENAQESQITAAQANVENIQAQIEKTVITAPFDGVIAKQDTTVGETAQANAPLITLISQKMFKVEAFASEIEIKNIRPGMSAEISLDGNDPSKKYTAKITALDPAETEINNVSNYKVTFEFDSGAPADLSPGAGANVTVLAASQNNAVLIPEDTIFQSAGKSLVLVPENSGPNQEKEVQTGVHGTNGIVEIVSGLSAGDKILEPSK